MTPDQRDIMNIVNAHGGECTKADIVAKLGGNYYCNGDKHVGDRISRMVKSGLLIRLKPGLYKIGKGKKSNPSTIAEGQTSLFYL